jgi:hypothetical protein
VKPKFDASGLREARWHEWLIRFGFGGIVTVATGLVAHGFGPSLGGLLLAFPAILPASLTLVKKHDGRSQATDDARGARIGSVALAGFASIVWLTCESWPPWIALLAAVFAWLLASVVGWALVYGARGPG